MRALWRAAIAATLLVAAAAPAHAEDAEPMRQGPPYAAIKTVMQKLYDGGDRDIRALYGKGDYDLYHCRTGGEYLGMGVTDDDTTGSYANLAFDTVVWSNNLKKMTYPAAVWQPPLTAYEAEELKLIAETPLEAMNDWGERRTKFLKSLAEKLAAYRAGKPKLRKIVVEGGCGAGEVNVTIATEPKGGQVLFIPTFFHELCKVQKVDPDDAAACTRWREAVDGTLSQVSGDYLYQVKWPDGATRKGKLSFNKLEEGQTVTLRKP
jgi:hypothetical protein